MHRWAQEPSEPNHIGDCDSLVLQADTTRAEGRLPPDCRTIRGTLQVLGREVDLGRMNLVSEYKAHLWMVPA